VIPIASVIERVNYAHHRTVNAGDRVNVNKHTFQLLHVNVLEMGTGVSKLRKTLATT
jgi:hypothetical protein